MRDPFHRRIVVLGLLLVLLFCAEASAQKYGEVDKVAPSPN